MNGRRTYWHLEGSERKPSEYDIVTSQILYYPARGFEVDLPLGDWNRRHQNHSAFRCKDWDRFRDPRETTYTKYTDLQSIKQIFVDGVFRSMDVGYDEALSPAWLAVLERGMAPLRYPVHGLQMLAAYVGHMAPGGRIVVASLFQAADEMRRIQVLAYRMRQLQRAHPGFGAEARATWEKDPTWQPLRELIERLLVTYDWGEAFVALNLVAKPALDELFTQRFGRLAQSRGDDVLAKLLHSVGEDSAWQRDWSHALLEVVTADDGENLGVVRRWTDKWQPVVQRAVQALAPLLAEGR